MNIDTLMLIFEHANKFKMPLVATTEEEILNQLNQLNIYEAHYGRYYDKATKCLEEIIVELNHNFGEENVVISGRPEFPELLTNPGKATIEIKGFASFIIDAGNTDCFNKIFIYGKFYDEDVFIAVMEGEPINFHNFSNNLFLHDADQLIRIIKKSPLWESLIQEFMMI